MSTTVNGLTSPSSVEDDSEVRVIVSCITIYPHILLGARGPVVLMLFIAFSAVSFLC